MLRTLFSTKTLPILIVLIICIPVVIPFFHQGYFPTHDGEWAVVRLGDMFRTLRDFQFPPRYSGALNFGYGYPLFNFAYPFPYYIGIILYFFFHSFLLSIKTIFVLSVFLSSLFMYFASAKIWNNRLAGVASAILYVYLPYRMVDLYVRGSIGESLSMVIFPLIFYFSIRLFDRPFSRLNVILLSVLIGMLVMTHNIMTILFMPWLVFFVIMRIIKEKRIDVLQSFFLCVGIGGGLSFFFWFPALYEKGLIALSKLPIADRSLYFVNLFQLVIPSWGYAPPTEANGFSYQLGVAHISVVLIALGILVAAIFKIRLKFPPVKFYSFLLLIIYLAYFVMMFSFTSIIWKTLPLLSEINYPWTILSQLGFISPLLVGFLVIEGRFLKYAAIGLCAVAVGTAIIYAKPVSYNNNPDQYYLTNEATTTSSDELMPIWVKNKPVRHFDNKVEVLRGDATVKNPYYNSKQIKFEYDASSDAVFKINTIFYPGWKAYINGIEVPVRQDDATGTMLIDGNKNSSKVYLEFGETLPRTMANGVSIFSIILLLFILIRPILLFNNED